MISNQILQNTIEGIKGIIKNDLCVSDAEGNTLATTSEDFSVNHEDGLSFVQSPADSQVVKGCHYFKVYDEGQLEYVIVIRGDSEEAYTIGKMIVLQIEGLLVAYKERYDKDNFIKNLLLDNLLLVDIYNRAKKLHIEMSARRVVFIIETNKEKDSGALETVRSMFATQTQDFITAVDEKNIILVKEIGEKDQIEDLEKTAHVIVDMLNTEAMSRVHVAFGTIVKELKEVSIFEEKTPDQFDEETLTTINKFFENNLNVSETSRQLYIHRNTLVYRLDKLEKSTGLDLRIFDDAITFKIALMVVKYMNYLETIDY